MLKKNLNRLSVQRMRLKWANKNVKYSKYYRYTLGCNKIDKFVNKKRQTDSACETDRWKERLKNREKKKNLPPEIFLSHLFIHIFFFFRGKGNDTNQMKTLNFKLVCIFETLNNVKEKTFCYKKNFKTALNTWIFKLKTNCTFLETKLQSQIEPKKWDNFHSWNITTLACHIQNPVYSRGQFSHSDKTYKKKTRGE